MSFYIEITFDDGAQYSDKVDALNEYDASRQALRMALYPATIASIAITSTNQ